MGASAITRRVGEVMRLIIGRRKEAVKSGWRHSLVDPFAEGMLGCGYESGEHSRRAYSLHAGRTDSPGRHAVLPGEGPDHAEDESYPGWRLRWLAARARRRRPSRAGGVQSGVPPVRQRRAPRRLSLSVLGLFQTFSWRGEIHLPHAALVGPPHRVRPNPGRRAPHAVQEEPHETVRGRGGPGPRALPGGDALGVEARRGLHDGSDRGA